MGDRQSPLKTSKDAQSDAAEERDAVIRRLQAELETARLQLAQRESLLAKLNQRLLRLEGSPANDSAELSQRNGARERENEELRQQLDSCRTELANVYRTKLFRWSSGARTTYAKLRRPL